MPDQTIPLATVDASERRSLRTPARPSGLPIFSTEPLTAAERDGLRRAARILRAIAGNLDEAADRDRVTWALQAAARGAEAGQLLLALATRLGSNR